MHEQTDDRYALAMKEIASLKQRDQAKDELLTTISHDLKSPLTSLQMAVHLLLEDVAEKLTPQQLELLTAARDDADRMQKMIADVLDKGRAGFQAEASKRPPG